VLRGRRGCDPRVPGTPADAGASTPGTAVDGAGPRPRPRPRASEPVPIRAPLGFAVRRRVLAFQRLGPQLLEEGVPVAAGIVHRARRAIGKPEGTHDLPLALAQDPDV